MEQREMMKSNIECLLVIDVQDTTINDEKPEWGLTLRKVRQTVPRIEYIVNCFRKQEIPVIWAYTTPWTREFLPWNMCKLYDENPAATFYSQGDMLKPIITPRPTERIFRKNMPSAFGGTLYLRDTLEEYLKEINISHIAICGFYGTGCVNATIVEGFHRGFFFYILRDCIETFDNEPKQHLQQLLMEEDWPYMYGHVLTSTELF
jgi:nicotinamidase-related amidase